MKFKVYNDDCRNVLPKLKDSIDLFITSPPYDTLRNYNNSLDWNKQVFEEIANQLYSVLKEGGVGVWVVNDKTEEGSKTLTSFNQALYFREIGFNIHDVMIFAKSNPIPQIFNKRYTDEFEYMFVLSKGTPKTCNPLKIPCKNKGKVCSSFKQISNKDDTPRIIKNQKIKEEKIKGNIWEYSVGSKNFGHPAVFPLQLAKDHILSWSNEGDVVLDCFMGSGTTGVACQELNRNFIGIEKVEKYYNIAKERCREYQSKLW